MKDFPSLMHACLIPHLSPRPQGALSLAKPPCHANDNSLPPELLPQATAPPLRLTTHTHSAMILQVHTHSQTQQLLPSVRFLSTTCDTSSQFSRFPPKQHPDPGLRSVSPLVLSVSLIGPLPATVCGVYSECVSKVCVCLLGAPPGSQLSAPASPASPTQDIWVLRSSPTGKSVWPQTSRPPSSPV